MYTIVNIDSIYYGVVVCAEEGRVYDTFEEAEKDAKKLRRESDNRHIYVYELAQVERKPQKRLANSAGG